MKVKLSGFPKFADYTAFGEKLRAIREAVEQIGRRHHRGDVPRAGRTAVPSVRAVARVDLQLLQLAGRVRGIDGAYVLPGRFEAVLPRIMRFAKK